MNPYPLALAILASLAAPYAAQAQDAAPDPFSRTMLTQEQIEALGPTPPPAASAESGPSGKTTEELLQNYAKPRVSSKPMAVKPVQGMASTPAAASAAQTAPVPTPEAPPARPRYVETPIDNEGNIAHQALKGQAKEAYYGGKYNAPAYALPSSASFGTLTTSLAPLVEKLRMQGIDEGKINVELNRLTPEQFIRWTDSVKY